MIINFARMILLFITYFFIYLSVRKITGCKNRINLLSIFAIISVAFSNYAASKLSSDLFKGIITYSGLILFACEIKRLFSKEIVIDGFISYVYVAFIDIICAVFVSVIGFSHFITDYSNMHIYKLIYSSICTVILYYSLYISIIEKALIKIKNVLNNSKVFILFITLIILAIESATIFTLLETDSIKDVFLSITLIVIFIVCLGYLLYNVLKKQDLIIKNDNLVFQSDSLLRILNNYKMFKHNMRHELMLIESVGNEKVRNLVKEYFREHGNISSDNLKDLDKIPNSLKRVIYQKLLEKADLKCDIFVENTLTQDPFDRLSTRKLSIFIQCICISLDNAIEAASQTEEGFVYIRFNNNKNIFDIVIENKFSGDINIDDICEPGMTNKDKHMGLGTNYLVSQKQFLTKISIRNNMFIVKISAKI